MIDLADLELIVWIWCGVLSGISIILILSLICICSQMAKLQDRLNSSDKTAENRERPVLSYGNPTIVPGEDLARRGFSVHTPRTEATTYFSEDIVTAPSIQGRNHLPHVGQGQTKNNNFNYNRQNSANSYYMPNTNTNSNKKPNNSNFIY